jgi:hypothetical protein
MNYEEAVKLGKAWTKNSDIDGEGWRAVIYLLLQRVEMLEAHVASLNRSYERVSDENEALSLDLGFKEKCFELPPQPQLRTIADIIRECERKI